MFVPLVKEDTLQSFIGEMPQSLINPVAHEYEQTLWKSCRLPASEYKNLLHVHLYSYKCYITSLFMNCLLFLL